MQEALREAAARNKKILASAVQEARKASSVTTWNSPSTAQLVTRAVTAARTSRDSEFTIRVEQLGAEYEAKLVAMQKPQRAAGSSAWGAIGAAENSKIKGARGGVCAAHRRIRTRGSSTVAGGGTGLVLGSGTRGDEEGEFADDADDERRAPAKQASRLMRMLDSYKTGERSDVTNYTGSVGVFVGGI